jgi:hypothetical protein
VEFCTFSRPDAVGATCRPGDHDLQSLQQMVAGFGSVCSSRLQFWPLPMFRDLYDRMFEDNATRTVPYPLDRALYRREP